MDQRGKIITNIQTELDCFMRQLTSKTEILNASIDEQVNETQAHILMLLNGVATEKLTNSKLAQKMNISKPAITKAVKGLALQGYLISKQDSDDRRIIYHELTVSGQMIAQTHLAVHHETNASMGAMFAKYSQTELVVIEKFINDLTNLLGERKD